MVSDVMSLVPKIDEIQEFLLRTKINLAVITETWLKDSVVDSVVDIPGYTIVRKDTRIVNSHGGVCLYIRDNILKYKLPEELNCCADHEILWVQLKADRLPRACSCLIAAVVYHPPRSRQQLYS